SIEHGHLRAVLDDNGEIAVDQLEIAVAPITLDGMFGKPAQLQDVILRLADPVRGSATWTSADDATTAMPMVFDVGRAFSVNGGKPQPLVTLRRPPDSVAISLTGTGDHVAASIDIDATGQLWTWTDLVEITEVTLSLGAETAD